MFMRHCMDQSLASPQYNTIYSAAQCTEWGSTDMVPVATLIALHPYWIWQEMCRKNSNIGLRQFYRVLYRSSVCIKFHIFDAFLNLYAKYLVCAYFLYAIKENLAKMLT